MADYRYRPRHQPPLRSDRVLLRPLEHVFAGFSVIIGGVLLVNLVVPGPLVGIYRLPDIVYFIVGSLVASGGLAVLLGLQWPRVTISTGWSIERAGWIVHGTGWAGATIVLLNLEPVMVFGVITGTALSTASLLRFLLLRTVEKQARQDTGKED